MQPKIQVTWIKNDPQSIITALTTIEEIKDDWFNDQKNQYVVELHEMMLQACAIDSFDTFKRAAVFNEQMTYLYKDALKSSVASIKECNKSKKIEKFMATLNKVDILHVATSAFVDGKWDLILKQSPEEVNIIVKANPSAFVSCDDPKVLKLVLDAGLMVQDLRDCRPNQCVCTKGYKSEGEHMLEMVLQSFVSQKDEKKSLFSGPLCETDFVKIRKNNILLNELVTRGFYKSPMGAQYKNYTDDNEKDLEIYTAKNRERVNQLRKEEMQRWAKMKG